MRTLLDNSASTENSQQFDGGGEVISSMILEVVDEGSWSGTIKVAGQVYGRNREHGYTGYDTMVAITDLNDGSQIGGDTGITAAGLYRIDTTGLECRLEHARTAGTVSVHGQPTVG